MAEGRFGELPVEVVLSSILSRLTMKEVARTSLVSRGFDRYWRLNHFLHLENPAALQRMIKESYSESCTYKKAMRRGRRKFVKWVNTVLHGHIGSVIQEFRVIFFLNNDHNKDTNNKKRADHNEDINNWVVWALSKHVHQLELDFSVAPTTYGVYGCEDHQYCLDKPLLDCINVAPVLTSLCLKGVNASDNFLNTLLDTCSATLENLCLMTSYNLITIQPTNACTALKYFKVYNCRDLETIDIQAPNLVSFTYDTRRGDGLQLLRIANASSLSHLFILFYKCEDRFFHILRSLSDYFPQLEYLKLSFFMNSTTNRDPVVDYFPVSERLKHLELVVVGYSKRDTTGWIPFIEACPLLEKLSLQLCNQYKPIYPEKVKLVSRLSRSLLCLKTFEMISDFDPHNVDIDVARFVLENAVNLEEVILRPSKSTARMDIYTSFYKLDLKIPQGVKLRVAST